MGLVGRQVDTHPLPGKHTDCTAMPRNAWEPKRVITLFLERSYSWASACHFLKKSPRREALMSFDRALAFFPDRAFAWNNRGNVLGDLGRHEEALASYDRALPLNPDDADAWYNRGKASRILG